MKSSGTFKVLVVDDELVNRTILEDFLGQAALCAKAENGAEAVEFFRQALDNGDPFDLVLMDIMMPGIDGFLAMQEIRSLERERNVLSPVKAIMVTALSGSKNVFDAYSRCQCNGYLEKPLDKSVFQQLISNLFPEIFALSSHEST